MFIPNSVISIRLVRPDGDRLVAYPWPSDEQLIERGRSRRQKTGAVSEEEMQEEQARLRAYDLQWLNALAPQEVELNEYEAVDVCDQMLQVAAGDVRRVGNAVEVELDTVFGAIELRARIPSRPRIARYANEVVQRRTVRGVTTISIDLAAAAALFDEICEERQLPVIYKAALCGAVLSYLDGLKTAVVNPPLESGRNLRPSPTT
jgi:hypothetical protein